jgi:alkylation response protein AidB-like acyl-CoA dehydrogenase
MTDDLTRLGTGWLLGAPTGAFTPEDFTEGHRSIHHQAVRFVTEEVDPVKGRLEAMDLDLTRSLIRRAGQLGLNGTDVPEKFGGGGLDKISTALVTEAMGAAGSLGIAHVDHSGIGILPLVFFGTPQVKQKYLPGLCSGELVAAYALTEKDSGSDALAARTRAEPAGDHYVLNGAKWFITNAGLADVFTVYAQVDGDKFTAFLVDKNFDGVSTTHELSKMGLLGSSTRGLILKDVRVPVENVLHEVGKGHQVALNVLNIGRYKLGAAAVGSGKAVLAGAVAYAAKRHQFGRPIASFGLIQEKLARMATLIFLTESMVYRTSGKIDKKLAGVEDEAPDAGQQTARAIEEYAVECSITKVFGSEAMGYWVDEYVQIMGGNGFLTEYPAQALYRDARVTRIFEGTNEINRLLIPGTILRRAMKGRLPLIEALGRVRQEVADPGDPPVFDSLLDAVGHLLQNAKRAALLVAGLAAEKFTTAIKEEQEVLGRLADMIIQIYALESGLLRAVKMREKGDTKKAALAGAMIEAEAHRFAVFCKWWAEDAAAYLAEGDDLTTLLSQINRLLTHIPINSVTRRRLIADEVLEHQGWPL